ncbi:MAG: sulfate adenylyltransferase subunit CysN [Hyphomicrobiaceae bacterium]|nr:sulfate adenylyltransferase subunit CysN [Hyphomicrobiaceae bacterium]
MSQGETGVAIAPAAATASAVSGTMPMLRFLTCGSVDDGKSTLIGRLLYDCQTIFEDTLLAAERDSMTYGTTGEPLDFALLVDGLQAEREQGITIDVAYRYFATPKRKFIVADTPGHEQYTRNMVTGASTSDAAIILVDARKGVLVQTRRHTCIVHLLGIKNIVLAVNKMDAVGYAKDVFDEIDAEYRAFAKQLGLSNVTTIPVSALRGENLVKRASAMSWYEGPTLLDYLENVDVTGDREQRPLRLPVQWVCRPNSDFRGYAGTIASGTVNVGDPIVSLPASTSAKIARILNGDEERESAQAGEAVVVTLDHEIDISRGDVLCTPTARAEISDQISANLVWMSTHHLLKGRPYILRCGTQSVVAQISEIKYKLNVESLEHVAARDLSCNEIGSCNISLNKPIAFDSYEDNRTTGAFVLIDRMTNETVGAGMIMFALRRSQNIHWQALNISREQRAELKGQRACCLWFTGLSGSGKSTIANLIEKKLFAQGRHTYILDGDNVRHGLNRDLGFTEADRVENIRRVAEVSRLMVDAGLITIVSFISPFRAERQFARERFPDGDFLEIFIDTPLELCEQRDPKGLYKKARAGQLANFTGINSPYEAPENPEIRVLGGSAPAEAHVEEIIDALVKRGFLHAH